MAKNAADPSGATPALVQRGSREDDARKGTPEDGLTERDRLMFGIGFLRRGQEDRGESEVRDLVRLQQVKDSGIYRDALKAEGVEGEGRPWDIYCRLAGWGNRHNANTRLAALREFGAETMRLITESGMATTSVKALLASPEEVRAEIESREKVSPDDMRGILDHIDHAHGRADRERTRADKERKRADKAERDAAKAKDKLIEARQDARDAQAELRVERDKKKIVAQEDVKRTWREVWENWERIKDLVGLLDVGTCRTAAAEAAGEFEKFREAVLEEQVRLQEEILG